jgi:hypothetical protein
MMCPPGRVARNLPLDTSGYADKGYMTELHGILGALSDAVWLGRLGFTMEFGKRESEANVGDAKVVFEDNQVCIIYTGRNCK